MMLPSPKFTQAPPLNPRDSRQWDEFWEREISSRSGSRHLQRSIVTFFADRLYVDELAALDIGTGGRVLFLGNGVSAFPYYLAREGWNVSALDFSRIATDFLAQLVLDEWIWPVYYGDDEPIPSQYRFPRTPGDHGVALECGDFLVNDYPESSFELVFVQNVVEYLHGDDRRELAQRVNRWLAPGGVVVVESQYLRRQGTTAGTPYHDYVEVAGDVEQPFLDAGLLYYRLKYFERAKPHPARSPVGRIFQSLASASASVSGAYTRLDRRTRREALERRQAGAKIAMFRFCS